MAARRTLSVDTCELKSLCTKSKYEAVIKDYPKSCLPQVFNERTGKAKLNLYEQINSDLYNTSILTFHTSETREQAWIIALHILYYEILGNRKDLNINWQDIPETWMDQNANNYILIEVRNAKDSLLFNVTFFTATGTIRVQGSDYMLFHELHFNLLIEIVNLVACDLSENTTSTLQPGDGQCDEHETIAKPDHEQFDEHETVAKHFESIRTPEPALCTEMPQELPKSYDELTDCEMRLGFETTSDTCTVPSNKTNQSVSATSDINMAKCISHMEQLQDSVTIALDKLSIGQTKNTKDIMQQLQQICSQQNIKNSKSVEVLEGKIKSLQNELQLSKYNANLSKEEFEYHIRHLKELLDKTRKESDANLSCLRKEIEFLTNSITIKNEEIDDLSQKLKTKTDEAECLAENVRSLNHDINRLKTTPSVTEEHNLMFQIQQNTRLKEAVTNGRTANAIKPVVWLIGTSNMNGINEDKLTSAATVNKYIAYTFDMVRDTLTSLKSQGENQPSAIVLHILTNELKSKNPESCVSELQLIVSEFGSQWPAAKICVSLTTPRFDDPTFFTKGQIINAVIKEKLADRVIIDHSNMLIEGYPNAELLSKDGYHLNVAGTSMLASNIKQALHACLNLPHETRHRSRSRGRTPVKPRGRYPPNVRGRARGRGYPRQY